MVASIKLLHLLEAFSTPWFLFSAPSNHMLVFFLLEIFNNIIQYQFDGNSNLVYTIIRKRHVFHALANLPTDMPTISRCLSSRHNKSGAAAAAAAADRQRISAELAHAKAVARKAAEDAASELTNRSLTATETRQTSPTHRATTAAAQHQPLSSSSSARSSPVTTPSADRGSYGDLGTVSRPESRAANGAVVPNAAADGEARSEAGDISMEGSKPAQPAEPGTLKVSLLDMPDIHAMTERESAHPAAAAAADLASTANLATMATFAAFGADDEELTPAMGRTSIQDKIDDHDDNKDDDEDADADDDDAVDDEIAATVPVGSGQSPLKRSVAQRGSIRVTASSSAFAPSSATGRSNVSKQTTPPQWTPTPEWVATWRSKLPLQTIMRLLQVLVPQVEKICIDK